ncbi:secreted RxLR effector protein like [Capsicum galapagoense]
MYLANTTRPITFSVNLLARYISAPTMRHQNGIKHMSLFYSKDCGADLIGHADDGYLFDSHKTQSQIGYVFICGGTAISWRYTKQSIVATSSNHAEIIAIHEASRECVWLRSMIHIIREKYSVKYDNLPIILYRDNSAYIAHLKGGFINGDRTKHILPKLFYIHELQKNDDINVQQIRSTDNVTDLFTKSSPIATFKKMLHKIEMQRSRMFSLGGVNTRCTLFPLRDFVPLGFPCKVFNEAAEMRIIRDVYSFFFTRFFFLLDFF